MSKPKRTAASWKKAREAVCERADGLCEGRIAPNCTGQGAHAHHVRMRSQGGTDDLGNLRWLCNNCHSWVHANPFEAYKVGLLQRAGAPEAPVPPFTTRQRWAELTDACRRFDAEANRHLPNEEAS